jgi:hypothetical protein
MSDAPKDWPNLTAPRFRPGQSGNPGGKTSEQRRLEVENAARATRIRAMLLEAEEQRIADIRAAHGAPELTGELLKLVKDSEDRGLGTPMQRNELSGPDGAALRIEDGVSDFTRRLAGLVARTGADGAS